MTPFLASLSKSYFAGSAGSGSTPCGSLPSAVVRITDDETYATTPSSSAHTITRESFAATPSRPVPTYGRSLCRSGTPWRIMFAPMSARFASSCSRNGMRPAAIEITCIGATSMYCTSFAGLSQNSVR